MRSLLTTVLVLSTAASGMASGSRANREDPPAPAHVTLKAPDGIALKATYYPAAKPGPGIVLLHACNRDRTSWTELARAAASRGFHLIALDYRGFGESGGENPESLADQRAVVAEKWPGDVDAALAHLKAQPGVDGSRIAAAGASCGVNQSVALARRHREVKTVVMLSGGVNQQGREFLRTTDWMPILAAASHDDGDAVGTMRWVLGWSRNRGNKSFEYQAAGHGTDMFAVEKALVPAIVDWFDANLKNAPLEPAATSERPAPTRVEEFWTALSEPGGVPRARQMYDDSRGKTPKVVLFPQGEMNLFGYQLLQEGRVSDAIAVFTMNAEEYPASANVYDSLSDGHLAAGNKAEALRLAEKTLQVLETDTSAPDQFKTAIRESAEKKLRELRSGKLE
jgi:dienelactone hydrolase